MREIAFCIDQKIDFIKEEGDDDDNHDSNDADADDVSVDGVFSYRYNIA